MLDEDLAILLGILPTPVAIEGNIRIIRVFARMREMLVTQQDILLRLEQLERHTGDHSKAIEMIFSALRGLLQPTESPRKAIGFVKCFASEIGEAKGINTASLECSPLQRLPD